MYKGPFINYVRMILAIFHPLTPCKGTYDFSNPSPYSYVRFFRHFVVVYDAIGLLIRNKTCQAVHCAIIRSQEKNLNQNRDSNLGPPDF